MKLVRERSARRATLVATLSFACLGATASPALGDAFVDRQSNTIVYRGDGGAETMTVTGSGDNVTMTANVTIDVDANQQDPGECTGDDTMVVTCDATGRTDLFIEGGPLGTSVSGNDVFTVTSLAADMNDVDIFGEDATDQLTGSSIADTIDGGAGDDTLNGGDGNDSLRGESVTTTPGGTDTLNGGEDQDTLLHSDGPDTYNGGNGIDEVSYFDSMFIIAAVTADIDGVVGDDGPDCPGVDCDGDTINTAATDPTGDGVENLAGDDGNDTLTGNPDSTTPTVLTGAGGNDTMRGSSATTADGRDRFNGGGDIDTVTYAARTDEIVTDIGGADDGAGGCPGGAGCEDDDVDDSTEIQVGGTVDDDLSGEDDDDNVTGDTLNGGPGGDDELQGSPGTTPDEGDVFIGGGHGLAGGQNGANGDIVTYAARTTAVTVTIGNGANDGGGTCPGAGCENDDVQGDIENLTGGTAGDTLIGNVFANRFIGGAGDDTMRGGQGTGPDGADNFDASGGNTNDTVSFENRADTIQAIIGIGTPGGDNDFINGNVDNLVGGSSGDTLAGDADTNTLDGRGGDDILNGSFNNAAPDAIDAFIGGSHGPTGDTVSYAPRDDDINAFLHTGTAASEGDTLATIENLTGGDGDDQLGGNAGANRLDGGAGDDVLGGDLNFVSAPPGAGDVFIGGGNGTPTGQNVTAQGDVVSYTSRVESVNITIGDGANDGSNGCPGPGCEGDDIPADIETVQGSQGDDGLAGNAGVNILLGHLGADTIDGAGGADTLGGEAGSDTINARDGADDTIDCGPDVDNTAQLDLLPFDDPATGCETVNRALFVPPAPPAPPPTAPPPAAVQPAAAAPPAKKCKKGRKLKKGKCVKKKRKKK